MITFWVGFGAGALVTAVAWVFYSLWTTRPWQ